MTKWKCADCRDTGIIQLFTSVETCLHGSRIVGRDFSSFNEMVTLAKKAGFIPWKAVIHKINVDQEEYYIKGSIHLGLHGPASSMRVVNEPLYFMASDTRIVKNATEWDAFVAKL